MQADYGSGKLAVAVQLAERPGAVLLVMTDRPHPADWNTKQIISIGPGDVAAWIRAALVAGWVPFQPGPQFVHRLIPTESR
jgi:hypothetical protein